MVRTLFTCLFFVAKVFAEGPFGFECGMTKDQIVKLVGSKAVKEGKDDSIVLSTVPKPHPAFEEYLVLISPDQGLLKLVAVGRDIQTNGYGGEVQSAFTEIRDAVEKIYGKPKIIDDLRYGSIWNEPREWMMGLLKKERVLWALWNLKSTLPNHIAVISLEGKATSTEKGYLSLAYEFDGWDQYVDSKKAKAGRVF